jgi:hypothetical protein
MYVGRSSQFHIVSTITKAAASELLTDLATVKAELNLVSVDANRDAVLTRYIAACSQAIQTYCNRIFAVQTIEDQFFPQRDAPISPVIQGVDPIQLSRWPIVALLSVVEWPSSANPVTLTSGTDFLEDDDAGQLIRLDKFGAPKLWSTAPLTVQYSAGYATLPADVVDACIDFVKFRYFARMRDPSLKSENVVGVYEASYLWGTGPGGPDDMPATVAGKIDRYRVPVIG